MMSSDWCHETIRLMLRDFRERYPDYWKWSRGQRQFKEGLDTAREAIVAIGKEDEAARERHAKLVAEGKITAPPIDDIPF